MLVQSPAAFREVPGGHPAPLPGEVPGRAKKPAPRRVLIVDDEPLVRWALAETLGAAGYDVHETVDAETTVRALLDGLAPAVVLLDLRLPDCADLTLLETVRRLAPRADVVLMTAFGTRDVRDQALRLGAALVLDKPFDVEALAGVLSRMASRH